MHKRQGQQQLQERSLKQQKPGSIASLLNDLNVESKPAVSTTSASTRPTVPAVSATSASTRSTVPSLTAAPTTPNPVATLSSTLAVIADNEISERIFSTASQPTSYPMQYFASEFVSYLTPTVYFDQIQLLARKIAELEQHIETLGRNHQRDINGAKVQNQILEGKLQALQKEYSEAKITILNLSQQLNTFREEPHDQDTVARKLQVLAKKVQEQEQQLLRQQAEIQEKDNELQVMKIQVNTHFMFFQREGLEKKARKFVLDKMSNPEQREAQNAVSTTSTVNTRSPATAVSGLDQPSNSSTPSVSPDLSTFLAKWKLPQPRSLESSSTTDNTPSLKR